MHAWTITFVCFVLAVPFGSGCARHRSSAGSDAGIRRDAGNASSPTGRDGGDQDAGRDASSGRADSSAGGRAGSSARDASPPPKEVPTTITLQHAGSEPLVLGSDCGYRWFTLAHEGGNLAIDLSCSCPCSENQSVCGCTANCKDNQQLVLPGKHVAIEWNGLFGTFDGSGCYELAALNTGDIVDARACWNAAAGPPGGLRDTSPICTHTSFRYGVDREVTLVAEQHSAAPTPVRIVLENHRATPIDLVTDSCGVQRWFKLDFPQDLDEHISVSEPCPCACNADFEIDPGSCADCGECGPDIVTTVPPGGTHSFDWDGTFSYTYASGCTNRYTMPAYLVLEPLLCFSESGAGSPSCDRMHFVHGQRPEVRTIVE